MSWTIRNHLECGEDGYLKIGGVDALELAEKYGTPLFVINEQRVRKRFREFLGALKKRYEKVKVCYAVKANPSLAILKILKEEGAGFEVVSEYELLSALRIGAKPEDIVFNGANKSQEELELAVKKGILINVDSLSELEKLEKISKRLNRLANICIRVNPGVKVRTHRDLVAGAEYSHFGIHIPEARKAFERAAGSKHISLKGVHMHIGSQITSTRPFVFAINRIFRLLADLSKSGIKLGLVDLGGGLGVEYEGEHPPTAEEYAEAVISAVKSNVKKYGLSEPLLIFEPGRYILADAGVCLLKVGVVKRTPDGSKWVIVDGGSNILLRAAMGVYRFKMILANKAVMKPRERVNIAGPLCFGGDVIGRNVRLPPVEEGDILAVFCAGAYTTSLSHQYNMRPRPPIVLVSNGRHRLIREAEQYRDLIARDIVQK
ncbi:MAG: diaminopimelate decarboxylase [Candidatus Hadarchaeales archaeon]